MFFSSSFFRYSPSSKSNSNLDSFETLSADIRKVINSSRVLMAGLSNSISGVVANENDVPKPGKLTMTSQGGYGTITNFPSEQATSARFLFDIYEVSTISLPNTTLAIINIDMARLTESAQHPVLKAYYKAIASVPADNNAARQLVITKFSAFPFGLRINEDNGVCIGVSKHLRPINFVVMAKDCKPEYKAYYEEMAAVPPTIQAGEIRKGIIEKYQHNNEGIELSITPQGLAVGFKAYSDSNSTTGTRRYLHTNSQTSLIIHGPNITIEPITDLDALQDRVFDLEVLGFLMENNFSLLVKDLDQANDSLHTPLTLAAQQNNLSVVKKLMEYGAKVHLANSLGNNALHMATDNRNRDIAEFLLSKDLLGLLDRKNKAGETPYDIAKRLKFSLTNEKIKDVQLLAFLEEYNFSCNLNDLDKANSTYHSPLTMAARLGLLAIVQKLVQHGADINKPNALGNTALHISADKMNEDITKWLLDNNASRDLRNNNGETAVDIAKRREFRPLLNSMGITNSAPRLVIG